MCGWAEEFFDGEENDKAWGYVSQQYRLGDHMPLRYHSHGTISQATGYSTYYQPVLDFYRSLLVVVRLVELSLDLDFIVVAVACGNEGFVKGFYSPK